MNFPLDPDVNEMHYPSISTAPMGQHMQTEFQTTGNAILDRAIADIHAVCGAFNRRRDERLNRIDADDRYQSLKRHYAYLMDRPADMRAQFGALASGEARRRFRVWTLMCARQAQLDGAHHAAKSRLADAAKLRRAVPVKSRQVA